MPNYLRAQVTIPMDSGLPEDVATNTWHFIGNESTREGSAGEVIAALTGFYQAIDGNFLAASVASPAHVKVYDVADPSPRIPIAEGTITLTPATGDPLPSQCCVVLSAHGTFVSGEPRARRRGRLFIGPLPANLISTSTGYASVSAAGRDILRDAADALMDDSTASNNPWAIYSPSTDASETLADAFFPVVGGWVDDRFDTQRRRLPRALTRDTFPV